MLLEFVPSAIYTLISDFVPSHTVIAVICLLSLSTGGLGGLREPTGQDFGGGDFLHLPRSRHAGRAQEQVRIVILFECRNVDLPFVCVFCLLLGVCVFPQFHFRVL